jgi:hypothetical protein
MATLTIPFPNFQNGQPIVAAQHNTNNTAIANFTNGLSAGSNFDNGAIGTAAIAGQAITTALLADGSITTIKLGASLSLTTPALGVATATSIAVSGSVSVGTTAGNFSVGTVAGLSTPTNGALVQGNVVYHIETSAQIASYTLVLADDGKVVELLNASPVTLTVPLNSTVAFPIGTQITILQTGAGQVTIQPTSGVTINANPGFKLRAQWTAGTLIKRATNTWVLLGDLSA